jgi:transcriptional regulator with XRE-family HTH domain
MIKEVLNRILKEQNLSQKEFAKILKITEPQVTRWLNEEQNLCSKSIIKICNTFNISADELLGIPKHTTY